MGRVSKPEQPVFTVLPISGYSCTNNETAGGKNV